MLQNHAWVKDPFKEKGKLMDFNVSECKKFTDRVADSTLKLISKKLPLEFCSSIKRYPQAEMATLFSKTYLCEARFFFIYFNQNSISQHGMQNQPSSIKPDIKEVCKHVKQYQSSHYLFG